MRFSLALLVLHAHLQPDAHLTDKLGPHCDNAQVRGQQMLETLLKLDTVCTFLPCLCLCYICAVAPKNLSSSPGSVEVHQTPSAQANIAACCKWALPEEWFRHGWGLVQTVMACVPQQCYRFRLDGTWNVGLRPNNITQIF